MRAVANILLTGGGGFAGRHLAPRLAQLFPSARRVAMLRPGSTDHVADWSPIVADIVEERNVADIIAELRPDLIVHLAAQASVGQGFHNAAETWRVNLGGTFALSSAVARHASSSTFFFVSTAEVYGASFVAGAATEATPLLPLNAYSSSKAAAEHLLRDVLPMEVRLIVARSFNHTGPGQDERFVLPSFAAQIARIEAGRAPAILRVGNLDAERDFLDVRDVTDAYCQLITAPDLSQRQIVNVASGHVLSVGDALETMRRLSTRAFEIEFDPARLRPSDIPRAVGDPSLLKSLTGWEPKRSIEDMLRDVLDWWRRKIAGEVR